MAQRQSHNTNSAESPTPHPIETAIAQDRTRFYSGAIETYQEEDLSLLNQLDLVTETILADVIEISQIVAMPLLSFVGPHAVRQVAMLLTQINPLVVTTSTDPTLSKPGPDGKPKGPT